MQFRLMPASSTYARSDLALHRNAEAALSAKTRNGNPVSFSSLASHPGFFIQCLVVSNLNKNLMSHFHSVAKSHAVDRNKSDGTNSRESASTPIRYMNMWIRTLALQPRVGAMSGSGKAMLFLGPARVLQHAGMTSS
jgi:hypothetical protein